MIQLWYNNQQLLRLTLYKNTTTPPHRHQHLSNPHPLAGIVTAGILYGTVHSRHTAAAAVIDWAIKKDFLPRMDKDQHRVDKPHITATNITKQIQSGGNLSPKSKIKSKVCGSTVEWPSCSAASGHCLRHYTDIAITMGNHRPAFIDINSSGDCVHITGELPATIKMKDKTASGTIYIANLSHNLLGLGFIEPLGLLDIPLNQICKVVSSS